MSLKWNDYKHSINSLSNDEKHEIESTARIMASIIKRRKELNLSQRDLEKISGIKQSTIVRIERQKNSPTLDTLLRLMEPLGMTLTATVENDEVIKRASY